MSRGIILLSGGLDSFVSLGLCKEKYNIELALTFGYGQKSFNNELESSQKIAQYWNIEHKVIKLDWLKAITHNALVENKTLPEGIDNPVDSAKAVWVPNRNSVFLNIAAAFADSEDYDYIIIGANKEEAATFSDNSKEFISNINKTFEYSTQKHPKVIAPLINSDKNDIVRLALENKMPLELIHSCYGMGRHCGKCESCTRLKNALRANNDTYYTGKLF